jgi:hypothetical protein
MADAGRQRGSRAIPYGGDLGAADLAILVSSLGRTESDAGAEDLVPLW